MLATLTEIYWLQMLQKLLRLLFVFGLILFFLRNALASQNLMGHNWDFTFPYYLSSLNNLSLPSFYTWNQFNFGYPQQLTLVHLIPNLTYTLLVAIFGLINAPKVLLILTILLSYYGFQKLQRSFVSSKTSFVIPSLIYCFSPFLFGEVVGGSWYMWVSYAAIPWYLSFYRDYLSGVRYSLLTALVSSIFLVSSMQNFIIIESFVFIYTIITFYYERNIFHLKRYLVFHFALLVVNTYWLSVLIQEVGSFSRGISQVSFTNGFSQAMGSSQTIINIFNLSGYLDRNFYLLSLPGELEPAFTGLMMLFWAVILFYLLAKNKISNKSRVILLLFLLSLILVKGGNAPFLKLTLFLYEKIQLLTLYRSPQHLMLIPALTFPVLVAFFLSKNRRFFESRRTQILLVIIFAFISVGWWYRGDLGSLSLSQKGQNFIDYYSLPESVIKSHEISEGTSLVHRSLFLPVSQSPIFLKTLFQNNSQGGVSEYMYLTHPTFSAENNKKAEEIESGLCRGDQMWMNGLRNTNTLFITVRHDQASIFTPCARNWDNKSANVLLEKNKNLQKLLETQYVSYYQVKVGDFLPIISLKNSSSSASIEYKKIDPTRYIVNIRNIGENNKLLFLENFNQNWALQFSNPTQKKKIISPVKKSIAGDLFEASKEEVDEYKKAGLISDMPGELYISKNLHNSIQNNNLQSESTVNWLISKNVNWQHSSEDYANLWNIDVSICQNKKISCTSNQDGTYNIFLEIVYLPQKTYFTFLIISGGFFAILILNHLVRKTHFHD